MSPEYAVKEIARLSPPLTGYLEADPWRPNEENKYEMELETWRSLMEMARTTGIATSEPPEGMNRVTIEAPYLLMFVRIGRAWLDGMQYGRRFG